MLKSIRRIAMAITMCLAFTLCVTLSGALAASQETVRTGDTPRCLKKDDYLGVCLVWAESPSTGGGSDASGSEPVSYGSGSSSGDKDSGKKGDSGDPVVQGHECISVWRTKPQPPKSEPVWGGHQEGTIYTCYYALTDREGAGADLDGVMQPGTVDFWAADPPKAPAPPDPRKLAERAVAAMRLQAITVGIVPEPKPDSMGLVGMPNWMWVSNPSANTWGPITKTASTGPFSVTATAKVKDVVWDMGDGQSVTCGQGTPYRDVYGKKDSPTCGHTYTRQGDYTVRATSNWVITWSGIGQSGAINMPLTRAATVHIGEAQVLVQ